jgi:magnesium transporter
MNAPPGVRESTPCAVGPGRRGSASPSPDVVLQANPELPTERSSRPGQAAAPAAVCKPSGLASAPWLVEVAPSEARLELLSQHFGVAPGLLAHALDVDERPRFQTAGGVTLVVLRAPEPPGAGGAYTTVAFGVVLGDGVALTVCRRDNDVLRELGRRATRAGAPFAPHAALVHALEVTADAYLAILAQLNRAIEAAEDGLREAMENRGVLELLTYQKSLVHFTTALHSTELMLQRLRKTSALQLGPEDEAWFDEVLVEFQQALDTGTVARDILSETMDAFASIISNNLNVVMKFLASVTLVLTLPVAVASFYGMNVALPGQHSPLAFAATLAVSLALSAAVAFALRRLRWL